MSAEGEPRRSGMDVSCVCGARTVVTSRESLEAFVAAHEGCPDVEDGDQF